MTARTLFRIALVSSVLLVVGIGSRWRRDSTIAHARERRDARGAETGAAVALERMTPEAARETTRVAADTRAADVAGVEHLLRVVSAADRSPIRDALVRCWSERGLRAELRTSDDGMVLLPFRGDVLVVVSAADHCRRACSIGRARHEHELALARAGALEIRFVDESGAPVAGLQPQLVPPDAAGARWLDEGFAFTPAALGPGPERRIAIAEAHAELAAATEPRRAREAVEPAADDADDPLSPLEWGPDHTIALAFRDACDASGWRPTSDADGRASWSALPALAEYRWAPPPGIRVELTPTAEQPLIQVGDAGLHIDESAERSPFSGVFAIDWRATTRLVCTVYRATSVIGAIAAPRVAPTTRPVVKLFERGALRTTRGDALPTEELEAAVWTGAGGEFELRGVRPGAKVLRAWWQEPEQVFHFANAAFDVPAGRVLDVGWIEPRPGRTLHARLRCVDARGAPLRASDVFADARSLQYVLHISAVATGASDESWTQQVGIGVDSTFELRNLPDGALSVSLEAPDAPPRLARSSLRVRLPADREWKLAADIEATLDLVVDELDTCALEIVLPNGAASTRLDVHWIGADGSSGHRDVRRDELRGGRARLALELSAQRTQLLVHSQTLEEADDAPSWCWSGAWDPQVRGAPLVASLQPAADLVGRTLDLGGAPRAHATLLFSCAPFDAGSAIHWTHKCRSDDAGRFHVRGLVPNSVLRCSESAAVLAIGTAGAIETRDLAW